MRPYAILIGIFGCPITSTFKNAGIWMQAHTATRKWNRVANPDVQYVSRPDLTWRYSREVFKVLRSGGTKHFQRSSERYALSWDLGRYTLLLAAVLRGITILEPHQRQLGCRGSNHGTVAPYRYMFIVQASASIMDASTGAWSVDAVGRDFGSRVGSNDDY